MQFTEKMIGLIAAMGTVGGLMGTGALPAEAGTPLLTMIVGYLIGNGRSARNGDISSPAIMPRRKPPQSDMLSE